MVLHSNNANCHRRFTEQNALMVQKSSVVKMHFIRGFRRTDGENNIERVVV